MQCGKVKKISRSQGPLTIIELSPTSALKIRRAVFHSVDLLFFIEAKELLSEEFPPHGIELDYRFPQLPGILCTTFILGCFCTEGSLVPVVWADR